MIALLLMMAAQTAVPAPTPASGETRARLALAARGMSAAGIDTVFTIQRRHGPAIAAIMQRGRVAETAIRAALVRRPIDVDGFAHAAAAKNDAASAFQHEAATVVVEQLRGMSPADQAVLVSAMASPPAATAAKR